MTYDVTVYAQASAVATIRGIEARSPEEAQEKALSLAVSGEAIWKLSTVDDTTISAGLTSKSKETGREYESPIDFAKISPLDKNFES